MREKMLDSETHAVEDGLTLSEIHEGRLATSKHVFSIATRIAYAEYPDSQPIPDHITGYIRKYLETVRAEAQAKREYAKIICYESLQQSVTRKTDSNLLRNHVDGLKQRQKHTRLSALAHYASESEKLAPTVLVGHRSDRPEALVDIEDDLETQNSIEHHTQKLEMAVVQARHNLVMEKRKLEAARARLNTDIILPTARLYALCAVRAELTSWIEESLASCGAWDLNQSIALSNIGGHVSVAGVEEAYENYVDARRRLVTATQRLDVPELTIEKYSEVGRRSIALGIDSGPVAKPQLECWRQGKNFSQSISYTDTRLTQEEAETAEMLQRLGDESQLLPAYPMLSHSERFKRTASTLSGQQDPSQNKVSSQVEAWAFAAECAGHGSNKTAKAEVKSGNEAVARARKVLEELSTLKQAASSH